jgi:hypothetical protein
MDTHGLGAEEVKLIDSFTRFYTQSSNPFRIRCLDNKLWIEGDERRVLKYFLPLCINSCIDY